MGKKVVLICDRCGFKLTGKEDVQLALAGSSAWETAVRERGAEPRGVYPCKNFVRCHGEMKLLKR